jgi:hypothetical protein
MARRPPLPSSLASGGRMPRERLLLAATGRRSNVRVIAAKHVDLLCDSKWLPQGKVTYARAYQERPTKNDR